ncbi:DUF4242 domain-containing protein [Rhizobium leguminosarum]|uniref:DUF4242 domain-containing protein n=1 Tax=Rhizobium leguminosarum TaxID=384 RepID=A0AAJ1A5Y4_RHILE|nr:DUF4242 domain-containing protein [Rhizobium leguminosarum]MBY5533174.1 DUF4242 domain-containing protein [Rhizobium leguminosarum]MBY5593935.1 DUF4242 domain-containing protein [Rhizobium leguminosarum]MBY5614362.1 DUF4242 domain-containing protein [Rhizobium leguminosarum]MBY5627676.1 DUF4242 domain-containing protein [Rhizobium leguminosarum]MBY5729024.1 DUF4242 domain-containing protein [Rhizobium leguminosarum]
MPIFIDRHFLEGTTAADVARAHRMDLDIQDKYGVKFLTYWFDQRRGTAFCLVDAPDAETAQCVHREAHGFVAGEIVEVALSAVEAFLGRIHDPEPAPGQSSSDVDPGHRAILFTDIVGSTAMTSRLGDRLAAARLCAAASSDQILVSENIFREYGAADLFAHATRRRFKGFSKPILVFRCDWASAGVN